jgi:adenylylsulfate kinase-like enzyme
MDREPLSDHESDEDDMVNGLPPCVVFLNGFPGVGKYTVAKGLQTK